MGDIQERYRSKSPEQALAHLVEEMGEALAAAGKTQRWGPYSYNPELPAGQRELNIEWLQRELADVERAIAALRAFDEPSDASAWSDWQDRLDKSRA